MTNYTIDELNEVASEFFFHNYDYAYMASMLEKSDEIKEPGATLITGSSHALNGVWEPAWNNAISLSMHSQDLYYDYVLARRAIDCNKGKYKNCFIVMGYYIAFQDLSLSKWSRENVISKVYMHTINDSHNWENPTKIDLWDFNKEIILTDIERNACESAIITTFKDIGSYYSHVRKRGAFFDLEGKEWHQLTNEDQDKLGKIRAESHNKIFEHKDSYEENKVIINDYINFLHEMEVTPIVVIPPFTSHYNKYVDQDMKQGVMDMLNGVEKEVQFVDFNTIAPPEGSGSTQLFDDTDFMDTDHLNQKGAVKMSTLLADMFGP